MRFLMLLLILLIVFATVVSYTRATWISILASMGVWAILKLKIRFEIVLVGAIIVVAFFFSVRS